MPASVKFYAADGATQVSGELWPDIYAGTASTALKYLVENNGDRDIANATLKIVKVPGNEGDTMARIGADAVTASRPFGLSAALSGAGAGGVFAEATTYGYKLTAITALGETVPCDEASVNVDVTTKKVTLSWLQVPRATAYKVYRTGTPGAYGASSLRATIGSGSTTSYTDDGSTCSAGTPPAVNTTGGAAPAYGTPPTLATSALTIGALKMGQQFPYWVNWSVPGGTMEPGNPRLFDIVIEEG